MFQSKDQKQRERVESILRGNTLQEFVVHVYFPGSDGLKKILTKEGDLAVYEKLYFERFDILWKRDLPNINSANEIEKLTTRLSGGEFKVYRDLLKAHLIKLLPKFNVTSLTCLTSYKNLVSPILKELINSEGTFPNLKSIRDYDKELLPDCEERCKYLIEACTNHMNFTPVFRSDWSEEIKEIAYEKFERVVGNESLDSKFKALDTYTGDTRETQIILRWLDLQFFALPLNNQIVMFLEKRDNLNPRLNRIMKSGIIFSLYAQDCKAIRKLYIEHDNKDLSEIFLEVMHTKAKDHARFSKMERD